MRKCTPDYDAYTGMEGAPGSAKNEAYWKKHGYGDWMKDTMEVDYTLKYPSAVN